jgi:hypothetical protein
MLENPHNSDIMYFADAVLQGTHLPSDLVPLINVSHQARSSLGAMFGAVNSIEPTKGDLKS